MNKGYESCKSLSQQLGSPYTAMKVGKLRKALCDDEDLEGNYIKPSGVVKIMRSIGREMEIIETASPDIVKVKVLHHQTGNKHFLFAMDLETKRKVKVLIPFRKKQILNTVGKRLNVERGLQDGTNLYRYTNGKG
jgi:hypothetical protein